MYLIMMNNVNDRERDRSCTNDSRPAEEAVSSSAPYPEIKICERNRLYGQMMLDNMGGQNSEMTAVSLYLYNNLLIDENERLSGLFRRISIVEMHHLHMFGEIARMMGENPRLWTHRGRQMSYWSPAYNKYPTELKPLLVNAWKSEKQAVEKYQEQCVKIQDVHIVACLKRIILDEELHIQILEKLYEEYCS